MTIKDVIKLSKKSLYKEHTELVKILRTGSKEEREKEASEQAKEMKKYK